MNFHLFVHVSCSLATRIEGEMTGLSFLSGKSFIPLLVSKSNLTFSQIISSNDNSLEIESKYHPTPTPIPLPTPSKKPNRPGQRERRRKRSMAEKVEQLVSNGDLTEQEFDVKSVAVKKDKNGHFICFFTEWEGTEEQAFSFYNNPKTLIEKCPEFEGMTEDEVKVKLRQFAGERDKITYEE